MTAKRLLRAVERAIHFLRSTQLPHGEFKTLLGSDKTMSEALLDSSPFVTSFALQALALLPRNDLDDIVDRAAGFLRSEMEFGGVWRYWSSRQPKHFLLPPDLDSTACISAALRAAGRPAPNNLWAFRHARDRSGRFRTWLTPAPGKVSPRFQLARGIALARQHTIGPKLSLQRPEDRRFADIRIRADDADPVVNANAISYLGEGPETSAAVEFVKNVVENKVVAGFSIYYQDSLFLHHAVARAYRCAAPSFATLRDAIINGVLARASAGAFDNPLCAAAAASTLVRYDAPLEPLSAALDQLIAAQRADGGWDAYPFYAGREGRNFWGSEALTTAFSLEALMLAASKMT